MLLAVWQLRQKVSQIKPGGQHPPSGQRASAEVQVRAQLTLCVTFENRQVTPAGQHHPGNSGQQAHPVAQRAEEQTARSVNVLDVVSNPEL